MGRILIIAEHDGNELNPSTARCVSCAAEFSGLDCDIAVLAKDGQRICEQAATLDGVSNVVRVDNDANEHALAAIHAPQIAKLAEKYSHLFGPSTTFGKDLMPRVAALLNSGLAMLENIEPTTRLRHLYRYMRETGTLVTVEAD